MPLAASVYAHVTHEDIQPGFGPGFESQANKYGHMAQSGRQHVIPLPTMLLPTIFPPKYRLGHLAQLSENPSEHVSLGFGS